MKEHVIEAPPRYYRCASLPVIQLQLRAYVS